MLSSIGRNTICNRAITKHDLDLLDMSQGNSVRYQLHYSKGFVSGFLIRSALCNFVYVERSKSETLDLGRYEGLRPIPFVAGMK